jgi:hypothetical protein
MRASQRPDALMSALDDLAALAGPADSGALRALQDRLREARLRVLVVGEAKRGKSTLVNAPAGRPGRPRAGPARRPGPPRGRRSWGGRLTWPGADGAQPITPRSDGERDQARAGHSDQT